MDDNGRWRAIRVRANRVELRSTAVDPNGSNDLSNLLSGSNVRSVPFDDSSGDGLPPSIRSVPIDVKSSVIPHHRLCNNTIAAHLGQATPFLDHISDIEACSCAPRISTVKALVSISVTMVLCRSPLPSIMVFMTSRKSLASFICFTSRCSLGVHCAREPSWALRPLFHMLSTELTK